MNKVKEHFLNCFDEECLVCIAYIEKQKRIKENADKLKELEE